MSGVRTPSGRIFTELGNPPGRPIGPTQHMIPVGPPPTTAGVPMGAGRQIRAVASPSHSPMTVGFPNLNSSFVNAGSPQLAQAIPWTQFGVNLWRLAQPTGIVPGTYAGIIFNVYGQAISASTSGAAFDGATLNNPTFTGTVTAPTPPANDNSDTVATTAWVREQGYATEGFVTGQGYATQTYVQSFVASALVPYATQAWVNAQGFIRDAPADGNVYGRQNGTWVVVAPSGGT